MSSEATGGGDNEDVAGRMSATSRFGFSAANDSQASDEPAERSAAAAPPRASAADNGPQTPPPPPEQPKRKRRRDGALVGYMSGVFTFFTLLAICAAGGLYWGKLTFDGPGPLAQETTVMIQKNQGLTEISDNLERAGVISQPLLFKAGVGLYRVKDRLRYGEYAFPAGVSMREAMEILVSGKSIEHTVTIPEGLTSLQIVERLRDQPLLTGDIKETPAEGSLLPETYSFTRGASREQIIARMQQHQKAVLDEVWRNRKPVAGVKTPADLVTLASLVEKETGVPEERPLVASVFANRLAKGMRLQSDPTIVYGIVGGRGTLGRSLNRTDIASRTPYNTYVVSGLPAGPIANPGKLALEAAARPAEGRDLYFVADGTGGHAFAPSLVEHNKNVAKWRQVERQRGAPTDRVAPDDAAPEAEAAEADATPPTAAPPTSAPGKPKPKPAPAPRERRSQRQ